MIAVFSRKFRLAVRSAGNDDELLHVTKITVITLSSAKQAQDAVLQRSFDPVRCFSAFGAGNFSFRVGWENIGH